MLRTILLGCALAATALPTTPASAEEICIQVEMNAPVRRGTGMHCRYEYSGFTVCGAPSVGWGPTVDVDVYYCIPQVFPPG